MSLFEAKLKSLTLDSKLITDKMDKATKRSLMRAGGFIRTAARRMIKTVRVKARDQTPEERAKFRDARRIAKEKGEPLPKRPIDTRPSKPGEAPHSRTGALKNSIFFSFDKGDGSVVVGPELLPGKDSRAPQVLEFGGDTKKYGKQIHVAARPFMGPAFQKALDKGVIPIAFRDSVR